MAKQGVYSQTLCWDCANAVPNGENGCPWSRGFNEVEGWLVSVDKFHENAGVTVVSCPLFKRDASGRGIYHVAK